MTENIFKLLDEEDNFIQTTSGHFESIPNELSPVLSCQITIDEDRLRYAYGEYTQGVKKFSMFVSSGDPDHLKRSGALLHALYLSQPITAVEFDPDLEDADTLITPIGVTYGDAEDCLSFGHFYDTYCNEFAAFSLAFDICRQFEEDPREIDFEYVNTVCAYLKNNRNLSVESLFMMFKSLMK